MKDWKGNEIEVGHTVITVSVKPMFQPKGYTQFFINEAGEREILSEHKIEPKEVYMWEVAAKSVIVDGSEIEVNFETGVQRVPIGLIEMLVHAQPYQINCIEGISDNQDEYYLKEFSQ